MYSKASPTKALGSPQNWTQLATSPRATSIISDGVSLFASWGIFDSDGHPFYSAPVTNPTSWTNAPVPTKLANGANAFAYDPVNHILYAACYSGGLMRLITKAP